MLARTIVTVGFLLSALTAGQASGMTLARGGEAAAVIVVPEGAAPPVVFAGEELKWHLDQMTGGDFEIVAQAGEDQPAVVLGVGALSRKAGIDVDALPRDGYVIRTMGPKLLVVGRDADTEKSQKILKLKEGLVSPRSSRATRRTWMSMAAWDFDRGTLYGVYRVLGELGARWFLPGPKGTAIPKKQDVMLPPMDLKEAPAFQMGVTANPLFSGILPNPSLQSDEAWEMMQYLGFTDETYRLWLLRMRSPSGWMAFNHYPNRTQWKERFGEEHPEYFALLENGRRGIKGEYLNYTNPDVFREVVADIDAYFAGKSSTSRGIRPVSSMNHGWNSEVAYGDTFSLLPADGTWTDLSPASGKFVQPDAPRGATLTNLVWQFVNRVARDVGDRWPDKKLTCLAYGFYNLAPDPEVVARLPDNVIVGRVYGRNWVSLAWMDDKFRRTVERLNQWEQLTSNPMLLWQHFFFRRTLPRNAGMPNVMPHAIAWMARNFWEPHFDWIFLQHDPHLVMDHINRYAAHRLFWDPNLDVDALLEDYATRFYGPAAEHLLPMIKDIERRYMRIRKGDPAGQVNPAEVWEQIFSAQVMSGYRQAVDQAHQATQDTTHAEAVELFDRYFFTPMVEGRRVYLRQADDERAQVPLPE